MTTSPFSPREPNDLRAAIAAARLGDLRGETALFNAFYARLRRRAARGLESLGPLADPSHIADSAINSLVQKFRPNHPRHERVARVTDEGEARAFLFNSTRQKVIEARRFGAADKRGEDQTTRESDSSRDVDLMASVVDPTKDPAFVTEMADFADKALAQLEPRERKVTELKLFAGWTMEEIAKALDRSKRSVENDWASAKAKLVAFLAKQMDRDPSSGED